MRSAPFKILVHEYVSGGGWQGTELPAGLTAEGLAMLQAVLRDFHLWGKADLVTTVDDRLNGPWLAADRVVNLSHGDLIRVLGALVSEVDAALIVAPETDGVLTLLSALVENSGTSLLGSSSSGVAIASDKWDCFLRFTDNGLPTPNTWRVSRSEAVAAAAEFGFPLVVKPIDGVGCEGVSMTSDSSSFKRALEIMGCQHKDILLQQYVPGAHASVSLLASKAGVLPLSLNEQVMRIGVPSFYQGGVVPLEHSQWPLALEYGCRAASLIPGLRGYVGVDMVLSDGECYVIEINPRLTTSYLGLRQVINFNLAEAIWRACCDDALPQEVVLSGKASFSKEELSAVRNL